MSTKMLIDARHPEETRVVIQRDNKVEDFDFESAAKRQLKGNIYLAKVTRVEPSLQAAFVDYGGNRHGFLAFSEIHPDYYQIPMEDREALLREESAARDEEKEIPEKKRRRRGKTSAAKAIADPEKDDKDENAEAAAKGDDDDSDAVETVSGDNGEEEEELRRSRRNMRRRYKIQEVIKRRQILLVQVVKEERGNKGAALTTYLSLAGRYCVLMPNSTHGGGISRKIANVKDRKRLRTIMSELDVPNTMGCIIRTAGLERTKTEIKRDYDYLLRLWDGIREDTLKSVAPCVIHEEGDLIRRSIRDLYSRDIDQILVEGDEGYKAAKSFMRMLMPSHAKKVQQYKDRVPLFHRYQVESALETMYSPVVQLRSGGYVVINPTEALVAIDVNSGRSTREHNIEETALSTNLEAASEIARQLRMRDLAGLVVIDFIDMEDRQNIRAVERRLREALKNDRARVQVGRISSFGLMEMSRQRLHPGLFEASSHVCPTCKGAGAVRSVDSSALHALRALEDEALKGRGSRLTITLHADVALYLLNHKRDSLREIEARYGIHIEVLADNAIIAPEYVMDYAGPPPEAVAELPMPAAEVEVEEEDVEVSEEEESERATSKRRRRKRRSRGRKREDGAETPQVEAVEEEQSASPALTPTPTPEQGEEDADKPKRRRRGRRGGRNRRGGKDTAAEESTTTVEQAEEASVSEALPEVKAEPVAEPAPAPEPAPVAEETPEEKPAKKPARKRTRKAPAKKAEEKVEEPAPVMAEKVEAPAAPEPAPAAEEPVEKPKPRRGWWQRALGN